MAANGTNGHMNGDAKQSPAGKTVRAKAADGRIYFSYAQIHAAITSLASEIKIFNPDVIVAIGGGGFVPARMLRTTVKIPILAVSLELYDDATKTANQEVLRKQWYDPLSELGSKVKGGRVLIVDEVDDTRVTLEFCAKEVMKDGPAEVAVAVVHNKMKPKKGTIPPGVKYFVGEHVEDFWNCYPWDADAYGRDIYAHEALARKCAGSGSRSDRPKLDIASFVAGAAVAGAVGWWTLARPKA